MNVLLSVLLVLTQVVGEPFIYTVQRSDSLTSVGARFGIDIRVLAESNGLTSTSWLRQGQDLKIDNRHIVPAAGGYNIVVNIPQRMLFYFDGDTISCGCPIAAGKASWRTPLGDFEVMAKEEKPTWDVPPSIQEEMRRSGKAVVTQVPPSDENPLGEYWIALSIPAIGIHGTNNPSTIYKLVTHGCIRLSPDDIRNVFSKVEVGMRGRIVYEPVLITRSGDSVFAEAHLDSYKMETGSFEKMQDKARSEGFADMVDWRLLKEVIGRRDGIARDVTLR